ncbi:MAG: acyl carrier protein [Chromatiales bacterium]|jgi:acyl carrier protein|nr:acyl carrier protein [Chromatiales bacterium]
MSKAVSSHIEQVKMVLDDTLELAGRSRHFTRDTALLGSLPELDSMAVIAVLTSIEESFGLIIEDDEVDAGTFETLGTLVDFVDGKIDIS